MAEELTLVAESGRPMGSRESRRLRRDGKIPAVVYGHGMDPLPVAVVARELRHALNTDAGLNALITLDVSGTKHLAMPKQLQRDKVRGTVTHIDFLIVRRDEIVSAEVPIHLVGDAEEVIRNDGVIAQELITLTVHAKADSIPTSIEVDVSGLTVGDTVRVSDLELPSGVTTDVDGDDPVLTATSSTTMAEVEEADEAAAEAVEDAAADGAEEAGETAEGEAAESDASGGDSAEG